MSKQLNMHSNKGFTLAELLTVVAITTTLVVASIVGSINILQRARAAHIAGDLKALKAAWIQYAADTGGVCIHEDAFEVNTPDGAGTTQNNPETPCHDEIALNYTHLVLNNPPANGWRGPYIDNNIATDLWGRSYSYDNDQHDFGQGAYASGVDATLLWGANIALEWCPAAVDGQGGRYLQIADEIDEILDGGDLDGDGTGRDDGDFRWEDDPSQGAFLYLLSPDGLDACPN